MTKYIWLARLLHRHPEGLTRREISDAWAEEDDAGRPMASSTFYDNKGYLESRFGLRITCRAGRYRLTPETDDGDALLRRIVGDACADVPAATARPGDEWLPLLADAVANRRHTLMEYAPLDKAAYHTDFDPYFVRQIHGYCYVVGRSSRHGDVRNFAVDRIRTLTLRPGTFRRPAELSADSWFATGFGAFAGTDLRPEHVVLAPLTPRLAAYLRQRPLHVSQREETTAAGTRFHLDVALTPDFTGRLLALGTDVAVVAPAALRRSIADSARAILATLDATAPAPDAKA